MEEQQQPVRRVRRTTSVKRVMHVEPEAPAEPPADMVPPISAPPHVAPGKASRRALVVGVAAVLLTVGAVFGVRALLPSTFAGKPSPEQVPKDANQEVVALIGKVSKHILVRDGESPAVATVVEPESLRQQNALFYEHVEKGDRLLIWSDKAVLYSMRRDILLSVMPIPPQVQQQAQAAQQQAVAQEAGEKASVEVRNGSGVAGQGKRLANALGAAGLTTLPPGDAKGRYDRTLIINLSGKQLPKTVQALQVATGGETANLPANEARPKGDVLVIIGADYAGR